MTITGEGRFGLFGYVNGATIKNFSISGAVTSNRTATSNFNYGSIVGWSEGNTTLSGVHSSVNFTNSASTYKDKVGGLVGHVQSSTLTMDSCSFSGTLNVGTSDVDCMGGLVAYLNANNTATITNCGFYGSITSTHTDADQIGGFMGYYRGSGLTIQNCLSVGTITVSDGYDTLVGSIVGVLRQHDTANTKITNNYYLTGNPFGNSSPDDDITDGRGGQTVEGSATAATIDQMKSGEIAYALGSAWGQIIGTENYPVLGGEAVKLDTSGKYYNDVVQTDITWTAMEFTYEQTWNTDTLQYEEKWVPVEGGGKVTVENKSSVGHDFTIEVTYESLVDGITGSFDYNNVNLPSGEKIELNLSLSGEPTNGEAFTNKDIGTITVTVKPKEE